MQMGSFIPGMKRTMRFPGRTFSEPRAVKALKLVALVLSFCITLACGSSGAQSVELISPAEIEGAPGEFVTHVFKAVNNTEVEEICDATAASQNGWPIIGLMSQVRIPPRKRINIPITVHIPETALADTKDILSLTLAPRSAPGTEIRGTAVTKVLFVPQVALTLPQGRTGKGGSSVTYAVVVHNQGNAQDTFDVSVSSLRGWRVEASPNRVSLEPGGRVEVHINHFIPKGATPGVADRITIMVTSQSHPLATAQGTLRTEVAEPAALVEPDERLFHILRADLGLGLPSVFDMDSKGGESRLRLSGELRDDLRLSLDARAELGPKPGYPKISCDYLSLSHTRWKVSFGAPPPPRISWVTRPHYTQGLSLSSLTSSAIMNLLLSGGDGTGTGSIGTLAEFSAEIWPRGPTSVRLLHLEAWENPYNIFQGAHLSAAEVTHNLPPETALTVGLGMEADRRELGSPRITTVLNLRRESGEPGLLLSYKGVTPTEDRYGISNYMVEMWANRLGQMSLRGSIGHKVEYGQARASEAPVSSTDAALSIGLLPGITLGYTMSNTRSQGGALSEEDGTSSSLFLSFNFPGGKEGSRISGRVRRKTSRYTSHLRESSVETEAKVGWRIFLGEIPLELQVSHESIHTASGDISEGTRGALRIAAPLMEGRAEASSLIELESSKDNVAKGFSASLDLGLHYRLADDTTVSAGCKLELVPQVAEGQLKSEWSIGLVRRFNILIPKATAGLLIFAFEDLNGNGIADPGEPKLDGISFRLSGKSAVTSLGTCEFKGLLPGSYTASLDVSSVPLAMGYLWKDIRVDLKDREMKEVAFPLFRQGTIEGRISVKDEEPGAIPQGIVVKATPLGLKAAETAERCTFANPDGTFRLTGVYPGEVLVSIELPQALLERYEVAEAREILTVSPGSTVSDVTVSLRKKEKPIATTFVGGQTPSLTIRFEPEIAPRGSEPLVTVKSSRSLSRVIAVLPSGESFPLEGKDKNYRGRIWIPEDASPGIFQVQVIAEEPTGAKWTRRYTLTISEAGQLVDARILPAALRAGQRIKVIVNSLTAVARIRVSLPWGDTFLITPQDPYLWEGEYSVPLGISPGVYTLRLSLERSRGGTIERELSLNILK